MHHATNLCVKPGGESSSHSKQPGGHILQSHGNHQHEALVLRRHHLQTYTVSLSNCKVLGHTSELKIKMVITIVLQTYMCPNKPGHRLIHFVGKQF